MNGQYKVGDVVLGEWILIRLIGEGSYGQVFEAHREDFGRVYKAAIKIITIPQSQSEVSSVQADGMDDASVTTYFRSFVEEMVNEFDLMSKLKGHSNIVSYEDHRVRPHDNAIGWDIIIRMELLKPLIKHVREKRMEITDVVQLGIDICKALELCQRYSIVHRDIKPENIFISDSGSYKLGDFGIARTAEKTTSGLSKKGTYSYMAPEVYQEKPYSPNVDLYSTGLVLYWLLNESRTPFLPPYPQAITYSDRSNALSRRMMGEAVPTPKNADGSLSKIILKACAYEPQNRYASPVEMRHDLEAFLNLRHDAALAPTNRNDIDSHAGASVSSKTEEITMRNSNPVVGGSVFVTIENDECTQSIFSENLSGNYTDKTESIFNNNASSNSKIDESNTRAEQKVNRNNGKLIAAIAALSFLILVGVRLFLIDEYAQPPQSNIQGAETSEASSESLGKDVGTDVVEEAFLMPDLQSYSEYEAVAELEQLGCTVVVENEFSSETDKGIVLWTSISQGEPLAKGTSVTLYVSKGPDSNATINPDVGENSEVLTPTNRQVQLNHSSLSLFVGDSVYLSATGGDDSYTWHSSNNNVATVNNGTVNAVGNGSATITVTSEGVTASCMVTIRDYSLSISKSNISMFAGDTVTLSTSGSPSEAQVHWASSNVKAVTVINGVVKAENPGHSVITAQFSANGKTYTAKCEVVVNEVNVVLSFHGTHTIYLGETTNFEANTSPGGQTVNWSSSNSNVASVSSEGQVTAIGSGSAVITATMFYGNHTYSDSCSVIVKPVESMNFSASSAGQLTIDKGETRTVSLRITPDTGQDIVWNTSNPSVLAITGDGKKASITGLKSGVATVTASVEGYSVSQEYLVYVPATHWELLNGDYWIIDKQLGLGTPEIHLHQGDSYQLQMKTYPEDNSDGNTFLFNAYPPNNMPSNGGGITIYNDGLILASDSAHGSIIIDIQCGNLGTKTVHVIILDSNNRRT